MENRHQKDREWERLLRESLSEEKPEKQEMIVQNNLLRARMEQKKQRHSIPLWYLPGVLHALILLLAALVMMMFPIFTVYVTSLVERRNKEKQDYYKKIEQEPAKSAP